MDRGAAAATTYTGQRASYVALSAITILALALLCSIWTTDVSGSVALLGLFSIYLASQELLVLFLVFCPASIIIDLIRLSHTSHSISGRGWLIFLQLLEMAAKVAGGIFAWSLYRVAAGETVNYAPPSTLPMGSAYQRVEDPFATAYAPPRADFSSPPQPGGAQQQHQQQPPAAASPRPQQQPQQHAPATAGPPAAPHHDLV